MHRGQTPRGDGAPWFIDAVFTDGGWVSLVAEVEDDCVGPYPEQSLGYSGYGGGEGQVMGRWKGGWSLDSRGEGSRKAEEECWEDKLVDVSVSQEVDCFRVVENRREQG